VALLTRFIAAYLGLGLLAESCFFESKRDVRARVSASLDTGASSAATTHIHAKEVAEDITKNIADVGEVGTIKPTKAAAIHRCVAVLVIASPFVRVHEHAVGFSALLELLFRLSIPWIAVRMPLHSQLAVSAFDLLLSGRAAHAQDFVIVAFCLCRQKLPQQL
jgi:hypothetical protein